MFSRRIPVGYNRFDSEESGSLATGVRHLTVSCLVTECLAFWAPVSLNSAGFTPSQGESKLKEIA